MKDDNSAKQEKEKKTEEGKDGDELMQDEEKHERELTKAQETMIDNEVARKLKKERGLEGGVKIVREKVPFIW